MFNVCVRTDEDQAGQDIYTESTAAQLTHRLCRGINADGTEARPGPQGTQDVGNDRKVAQPRQPSSRDLKAEGT